MFVPPEIVRPEEVYNIYGYLVAIFYAKRWFDIINFIKNCSYMFVFFGLSDNAICKCTLRNKQSLGYFLPA